MKICIAILAIVLGLGVLKVWRPKVFILILSGVVLCTVAAAMQESSRKSVSVLEKAENGSGSKKEEMVAQFDEKQVEITVSVPEKQLTEDEAESIVEKERKKLKDRILGKNKSFNNICYDLELPDASEDGIVSIGWYSEEPDIIDMDGKISAKVSSKGEKVKLIAVLTLNSVEVRESFELKVYPKKSEGNVKEDLENNLESVNVANETDEYYLPKEVNGEKVTWYQKSETSACAAAVVILFLGVYIVISKRKKEEKLAKERLDMLARDYPEIVSRIMLMVCSGCTIRQAFMRIAAAYCKDSPKENRKKTRPAFEETVALCRELENGISETIAYDHMARRCGLPMYKTLAVLLTQSLQKGSTTIVSLLEQETMEALNEKKRRAKTATDAAALKLLLPLGMMLMVALALMLVPAMISF